MSRGLLVLWAAVTLGVAPVGPARAQGRLEIRAGGSTLLSHRAAEFEGAVGTGSGVMPGGEFLVRSSYVGIAGRVFGGAFSADSGSEALGRVHVADVRLLGGPPFLMADIGYGRRAFSGAFGDRSWAFSRLGVRSTLAIGASGLSAEFLFAYCLPLGGGDANGRGNGRETETRLVYTPMRIPVYVALGYRHERFTVSSTLATRPEEVSGIVMAAGMRMHLLNPRR